MMIGDPDPVLPMCPRCDDISAGLSLDEQGVEMITQELEGLVNVSTVCRSLLLPGEIRSAMSAQSGGVSLGCAPFQERR
jgi:hypothetical protein